MPNAKKESLKKPVTGKNNAPRRTATKRRKEPLTLVLPTGQANKDAIRSFMTDCLVPVLAKEFIRQRGKEQ